MIPRHIWQTYKIRALTPRADPLMRSWQRLNPGYEYHFLDDADIDRFMVEHFDAGTVELFRAMPLGVMRADIWRYAVLCIHGGVYADIDTECLVPLDDWLPQQAGLVSALENRTHFCQWTIAAEPGHGVLRGVLDLIRERAREGVDVTAPNFVHAHTGPAVWTGAISRYLGVSNATAGEIYDGMAWRGRDIELLPAEACNGMYVRHLHGSLSWRNDAQYDSWVECADSLFSGHNAIPMRDPRWHLHVHGDGLVLSNVWLARQVACNTSAALILLLCDGTRGLDDIAACLRGQLDDAPGDLAQQVSETVGLLRRQGVLYKTRRAPQSDPAFQALWTDIGRVGRAELFQRIKSSCADPAQFIAEASVLQRVGRAGQYVSVLDYGCGAGRNMRGIVERSPKWSVLGYDNPAMLERAGNWLPEVLQEDAGRQLRCSLTGDWARIMTMRFDVVVASLVLQHMRRDDVLSRLGEFAVIAPRLVVLSRAYLDEGGDVMGLIDAAGCWELMEREDNPPGSCHSGHWAAEFRRKDVFEGRTG